MTAEGYDVIVVGGGGSGLAAAAAAAQAGVRVLVLEKQPEIGGTTRLAVGSISAAGTRLQRRAGVADSAEAFQEDMALFTADLLPRDNARLRSVLARDAGVTIDWLEDLGVAFAGPYPEPPHRVHRMHVTVPGPRAIVDRLARAARRDGAQIVTGALPTKLLRDPGGEVRGVAYSVGSRTHEARARGRVVLASGDFSGDDAMRARHLASGAARALPINPNNRGDGFALAEGTGAGLRNMDAIFGPQLRFPRAPFPGLNERMPSWPWLTRLGAAFLMRAPGWMLKPLVRPLMVTNMSPSERLFRPGVVLVDARGDPLDAARPSESVAHTPERQGYLVMPASLAARFDTPPDYVSTAPGIAYAYLSDYERARPDLVHRGGDVAALARALGMEATRLAAALGSEVAGGWLALGPVQAVLTTTEGALSVDEHCRVLAESGALVPGLYAVGCMGQGGMLLRGHGLHLAWAFTSGRIAGGHAAAMARESARQQRTSPAAGREGVAAGAGG